MKRAIWNGRVLAEAGEGQYEMVEGNVYFHPTTIQCEYFKESDTHTVCPWKGTASYYTLEVDGKRNADAAWFYPAPRDAAAQIKDHVAFWRGVTVEEVSGAPS